MHSFLIQKCCTIGLFLALMLISLPAMATTGKIAEKPEGFSTKAWSRIMKDIEKDSYNAVSVKGPESTSLFRLMNKAHGINAEFSEESVKIRQKNSKAWNFELGFAGYGYENKKKRSKITGTRLKALDNRVEYQYDNITEWYINDSKGLEQGFTLTSPPDQKADGPIAIEMFLKGSFIPFQSGNQSIALRDTNGRTILKYGGLKAWDADNKKLDISLKLARLKTGESRLSLLVNDRDAKYPITIDPMITTEVAAVTSSDATTGYLFGMSVSFSGDTFVVGEYGNNSYAGAAYVYSRNKGGADNWGEVKKLVAPDAAANDYFGYDVAISNDTIVVGAPYDDDQGDRSGSFYVFERNSDGVGGISADFWGLVAKRGAGPDGTAEDNLGISVAISGDTIVVGANMDDDDGLDSGSAYVFTRNLGGADVWGKQKKLTAGGEGAASDNFGFDVALSNDTVIVGANGDDDAGSASGSAYVFERNQGGIDNWGQLKKITASDAAAGDEFGCTVSINHSTVVVGAFKKNDWAGAAYVFTRNSDGAGGVSLDNWGEVKKLTASDSAIDNNFGISVSVHNDMIVVGASENNDDFDDAGSAYIFLRNQGGADNWGEERKVTASDPAESAFFGFSSAISGDNIIIGAYAKNSFAGSVYVITHQGNSWLEVKEPAASDGTDFEYFGTSVAISNDTMVIGAKEDDDTVSNSGSAYVFERNKGGLDNWGQVKKLNASDPINNAYFGNSVTISNDTIVVGANGINSYTGAAYLFSRNMGGADNWGEIKKIVPGDLAGMAFYSSSLSLDNDTLVIGSSGDSNFASSAGSAYLFKRNQGGADNWGQVTKLEASDKAASDMFGGRVSINGDTIVISAHGNDDSASSSGSIYIFERNSDGAGGVSADNWGEVKKLVAHDAAENDYYGLSLALSNDTIAVSAYLDDDFGIESGSVYIYERNSDGAGGVSVDNWGLITKVNSEDASAEDQFGLSLDLINDTLVVGEYVFERNQGGADNWGQVKKLISLNPSGSGTFGDAASIDGDTIVLGEYNRYSSKGAAYVFKHIMDTDLDGISDDYEAGFCTDVNDADTDDDGLLDGEEDANATGTVDGNETDPCDVDSDGDGIQDGTESGLVNGDVGLDTDLSIFIQDADPGTTTYPSSADSDYDGIDDGLEDPNFNGLQDTGESDPRDTSYTVTVIAGTNGTTDKTGTNYVDSGNSISIIPTASAGYVFSAWTGDNTSSDNPLVLDPITSDTNVSANFAPIPVPIGIPVIFPVDGSGNEPTLDWSNVPDAESYVLQYDQSADFTSPVSVDNIISSEFTLNESLDNGEWSFRVKAVGLGSNQGDWSETGSFKVDVEAAGECVTRPDKPIVLMPSNGEADTVLTPTLSLSDYNDPSDCDNLGSTIWRISADSNFESLVAETIHTDRNLTEYTLPDLLLAPGTTYYWKARFMRQSGSMSSEWSEIATFTTHAATGDEDSDGIPDELEVTDDTDLNGDSVPDKDQPNIIKTIVNADKGTKIGITSANCQIDTVGLADESTLSNIGIRPSRTPFGMISYRCEVPDYGDTAILEIYLSEPARSGAKWMFHDSIKGWLDNPEYVTFNAARDKITIKVTDGGYGDNDHTRNKIIVDPSGLGEFNSESGGGCFIDSLGF